ncbi:MAG: TetR/AcrR family transcriptional regulator [Bacilli bacterium]
MDNFNTIIDAYKDLVLQKKSADISIRDICDRAGLSRKTFYNYFLNRFDLLKKILLEEIEVPLRLALESSLSNSDALKIMLTNFLIRKDFYIIVFQEKCQNSVFESLVESLSRIISMFPKPRLTENEKEYVDYRFTVEIVYVIKKWIENGMLESPDTIAKIIMYPGNI